MPVRSITPILNVSDVGASFRWFETLGWSRGFAWNDGGMIGSGSRALDGNEHGPAGFGSVCSGGAEVFLCRGGQGSRGTRRPASPEDDSTDGVWMSWWLDSPAEVDALHARAVQAGLDVVRAPLDEPWGVREFLLRHPDGHTMRVSAAVEEAAE